MVWSEICCASYNAALLTPCCLVMELFKFVCVCMRICVSRPIVGSDDSCDLVSWFFS